MDRSESVSIDDVRAELRRRGISPDQIEIESSKPPRELPLPFRAYRATEKYISNPLINPFALNPVSVFPDKELPEALAAGGGVAGHILSTVPVNPIKFGGAVGAGLGNLVGQAEVQRRQFLRGDEVTPINPFRASKSSAWALAPGAVGRVGRIVPFLFRKGLSVSFGEEKVIPAVQGIKKVAQSVFGKMLKSIDPNTQIDGSDLLKVFFQKEGGGAASTASIVKLERAGERDFVDGLLTRFKLGNPNLNASEMQQLANIFDRKSATEHLADLAREKLLDSNPEVVPFMRQIYAKKIGDYNAIKNVLKIDPEDRIGLTERIADMAFNPEFKSILERNGLGHLIPNLEAMGRIEGFKNFLKYGGRTLQRAAIFRGVRTSR